MHRRCASVAEVLGHLFGPDEYGEHRDPRVVAARALATTAGGVDELQPTLRPARRRSQRRLVELLEQPVAAGVNPPPKPVWHRTLDNHASDPPLSDQQCAQVAVEFMVGVGLAPASDLDAVRWLAIRHGVDHVLVDGFEVAYLTEDGAEPGPRWPMPGRCGSSGACRPGGSRPTRASDTSTAAGGARRWAGTSGTSRGWNAII